MSILKFWFILPNSLQLTFYQKRMEIPSFPLLRTQYCLFNILQYFCSICLFVPILLRTNPLLYLLLPGQVRGPSLLMQPSWGRLRTVSLPKVPGLLPPSQPPTAKVQTAPGGWPSTFTKLLTLGESSSLKHMGHSPPLLPSMPHHVSRTLKQQMCTGHKVSRGVS